MEIRTNGVHPIKRALHGKAGGTLIVYASGVAGGAVATLGYYNGLGAVVPLDGGVIASGKQYKVDCGIGIDLVVSITGATGTTKLDLTYTWKE